MDKSYDNLEAFRSVYSECFFCVAAVLHVKHLLIVINPVPGLITGKRFHIAEGTCLRRHKIVFIRAVIVYGDVDTVGVEAVNETVFLFLVVAPLVKVTFSQTVEASL